MLLVYSNKFFSQNFSNKVDSNNLRNVDLSQSFNKV